MLDQELVKTGGKYYYKGSSIIALPSHIKHFENIKKDFIDKLIENIRDRFPRGQLNIISSFAVLGMRPISFIDKDQLGQWGDDKLQVLPKHYGAEQTKGNVRGRVNK